MTIVMVLTIISILIFVGGCILQDIKFVGLGVISVFFSVIFGWWLYGHLTDHKDKLFLKSNEYKIIQHDFSVTFQDDNLSINSDIYSVVTNPKSVEVYECKDYDHYGNLLNTRLELVYYVDKKEKMEIN